MNVTRNVKVWIVLFLSCLFCLAGTATGLAVDSGEDLAEVQAILSASPAVSMQECEARDVAARSGQNYWEFTNQTLEAEGAMQAYGPRTQPDTTGGA